MIYILIIIGLLYYLFIVKKYTIKDIKEFYLKFRIRLTKKIKITIGSISFLLLFWATCFHYTDSHQIGIIRNEITGELWLDDKQVLIYQHLGLKLLELILDLLEYQFQHHQEVLTLV